jgi:hypothetical protein
MRHPFLLATAALVAAAAVLPNTASAQTWFGFSVGTGYPGYRVPVYQPYGSYDDDARAAWIARQRWEERQRWEQRWRWEAREQWDRDEAQRRYYQHEYWEHRRWYRGDDDDD